MSESEAHLIVTTAATMSFYRRSWPEITTAITPVVGRARAEKLRHVYEEARVDLKRQDARQMLDWLRANTSDRQSPPVRSKGILARTRFVAEWGHWEIDQAKTPHGPVCDIHLLSIVQALVADYPMRHLRLMLESYLAGSITVAKQPPLDWREIDRGLGSIGVDAEWAAKRNLTTEDLTSYVLRRRQISRLILGDESIGDVPVADLESAAWEQAERSGLFGDGSIPAELQQMWLTAGERDGLQLEARGARVIARSHRATGSLPLRTGAIAELKVREDFIKLIPAIEYAWAYNDAIRKRDAAHNVDRLSAKAVTDFYLTKWGGVSEPVVAMTERGFTDTEDVSRRAGPFMLAARFGGLELGKS